MKFYFCKVLLAAISLFQSFNQLYGYDLNSSGANRSLNADTISTLLRGPYLQFGTSNSIIIRWRTDHATTSKLCFGTSFSNLNDSLVDTNQVTEHIMNLNGLINRTKYYYSVGSFIQKLQGDSSNYFIAPPPDQANNDTIRIWAIGDCGNNSVNQKSVRDKYYNYVGKNYTDLWLLHGDNAYVSGLDNEYQTNFFNIYKDKMLKQTLLCPAPGNHDYANNATLQISHNIPYYDMFSLPANAEAGGVASGTESYYSFNYANIHFVSLDSYGKDSSLYRLSDTLGPQARWLRNDLAANTKKWTIIYWHHPPYTMGSHNSDTEAELVNIRQKLLPVIERYNVDLVLCGHSHDYERSKLMNGYFGNEASFSSTQYLMDSSSALYDGSTNSCPYIKSASQPKGIVYAVVGSSGQLGGTQTSFPHNAMFYSDATKGGGLSIEIIDNKLSARWICSDGVIRDKFFIMKDVNQIYDTTITSGDSITMCASWPGNYIWSTTGQTSRCVTIQPDSSGTYIVTDSLGCLADTFHVNVCYPPVLVKQSGDTTVCKGSSLQFLCEASGSDILNYKWERSIDNGITWNIISDAFPFFNSDSTTLLIDTANLPLNGYFFRCKITNSCGTIYTMPIKLTVLAITTPSVQIAITSGNNPFLIGDTIQFFAATQNEGNNPVFQWIVNGNPVGTDSAFYSSDNFSNGDSILCLLVSTNKCITTDSVYSNTIHLFVNNNTGNNTYSENLNHSIAISPNPFNEITFIKFYSENPLKEFSISIYDVYGKKITEKKYADEKNIKIDAKELKLLPGIFIVEISTEKEKVFRKIIRCN